MQNYTYEPMYIEIDTKSYMFYGEVNQIGEPKTIDQLFGNVGKAPKGGFSITRERSLVHGIQSLRGKMGILLGYLIDVRDANNQLLYAPDDIARDTQLTKRSVVDNLLYFEEREMVSRTKNKIMLAPGIVHRGNRRREGQLIKKFDEMRSARKNGTFVPDVAPEEIDELYEETEDEE